MNQINSVCVYSASSTKIDPVYFTAAETLGRLLTDHHIRLINGAGYSSFYGRAELAPYRLDGAG